MKRIKIITALLLAAVSALAQDYMYAVPTQFNAEQAGSLSLKLQSRKNCKALQLTVELPEGVTLNTARTGGPFEIESGMYDATEGMPVALDYEMSDNGRQVKVLLYFTDGNAFTEKSGEVLRMYVQTKSGMPAGNYAIVCKEQVMAETAESTTEAGDVSSFVSVGDPSQDAAVNFSDMRGHIPTEVMGMVINLCHDNMLLTTVDFTGVTSVEEKLMLANHNAIVFLGEDVIGDDIVSGNNVAYKTADGSYYAGVITLEGDNKSHRGDFGVPAGINIDCEAVEFKRKFATEQWSTLCLPLAGVDQFNSEMAELGFDAYKLTGYTPETNKVTYTRVSTIEANTPYLVRFTSAQQRNIFIEGAVIDGTNKLKDVTADGMTMKGSYINDIISSDDETTYFGYDATNGVYKKVGKNVTLGPFRAYLALPKSVAANAPVADVLSVSFINPDDEATGIAGVEAGMSAADKTFNLAGVPVQNPESVTKQVLISNGKKMIR